MTPRSLDRREFLKLAGLSTATMALLTGCLSSEMNPPPAAMPGIGKLPASPEAEPNNDNDLDVKIGQMLMVGFRGLEVNDHNDPVVQDIRDRHIGGILLFNYDVAQKNPVRNIQSPAQVKHLVTALQAYAKEDTGIPLLVGIDYEGGIITRLPEKNGFPKTVSHQYLGQKNDLALTRRYATEMGNTLKGLGINLNFAPVVDVNTNPNNPIIAGKERSFSSDPNVVAKQALEYIKGHHQANVLCTLKHFPGHGSSTADSHLGMVNVTNTWNSKELIPYREIINAGEADSIMTAHVFNKNLDPKVPATLSKPTITGKLRQELKFNNVVFSDDMQMKAIASHYGLETAIRKTIDAGVDILVIGNNTGNFVPDIATQAFNTIKRLVQNGTISEARIEESYQRIQQMKRRIS